MKAKCIEYDPAIYPRLLWVVIGGTADDIKATFRSSYGDELIIDNERARGWTCDVERKHDSRLGVVVWVPHKMTLEVIAHEALHAAMYIFHGLGIEVSCENDEPLAYLVGWIAKCINEARLTKK